SPLCSCLYFLNDTATTEIYTLFLHDALPISQRHHPDAIHAVTVDPVNHQTRSEEHTSELQSHLNLVCRLLLEKNKSSCCLVGVKPERSPCIHHAAGRTVG